MVLNSKHRGYLFGKKAVYLRPSERCFLRGIPTFALSKILTKRLKTAQFEKMLKTGSPPPESPLYRVFKII